jgi:hypothetical protein
MKQGTLLLLLSLIVLAVLLYFSEPEKILQTLEGVNPFLLAVALVIISIIIVIRAIRWQQLLSRVEVNISLLQSLKIMIPSIFISNISPAKSAEPVRAILLKKTNGIDVSTSLPSIIVEKIFDVIITSLISATGLIFLLSGTFELSIVLLLIIFFYLVLLSLLIFVLTSETRIKNFTAKLISMFLFIKGIEKIGNEIVNFSLLTHNSFMKYNDTKTLFSTSVFTFLIWILEGILFYVFFLSLSLDISPLLAFIMVPISTLVGIISFLPGGFGSSEAALVIFISPITHLSPADILAAAFLKRIVTFVVQGLASSILVFNLLFPPRIETPPK